MIVCDCTGTTDATIRALAREGVTKVSEIGQRCGAGTGCGACLDELRDRLAQKGANGCPRDCAADLVSLRSPR